MNFNERLANTRKMKGLSQEGLADKMGVSRQAVSKWETGDAQPDYQKLVALADALDISMDYLCCRTDDVNKTEPKRRNHTFFAVMIVAVAVIAFFLGTFLGGQKEVVLDKTALPDTIEVGGVNFSNGPKGLFYHFVPSVVSDEFTYKIVFCDDYGNEEVYDVSCENGTCSGRVDLKGSYVSVTVVISDGKESRALPIAQGLTMGDYSASWTPLTE